MCWITFKPNSKSAMIWAVCCRQRSSYRTWCVRRCLVTWVIVIPAVGSWSWAWHCGVAPQWSVRSCPATRASWYSAVWSALVRRHTAQLRRQSSVISSSTTFDRKCWRYSTSQFRLDPVLGMYGVFRTQTVSLMAQMALTSCERSRVCEVFSSSEEFLFL